MIRSAPTIFAVVLMIALAGCAATTSSAVAISGQGTKSGPETKTLDCDASGHIAVGFQGQGTITVTVNDGAGSVIYSKTFNGEGQEGEAKSLSGEAGDWKLTATFSGTFGGYQGQYGITLSC